MSDLERIARTRRTPGVILLDESGTVLYANPQATALIPLLCPLDHPCHTDGCTTVPAELRELCRRAARAEAGDPPAATVLVGSCGAPFAVRLFPLDRFAIDGPRQVMLLAEPLVEHRHVDFITAAAEYDLSRREQQVLVLLCQGLSNREIAAKLFISEYTAKDHLKRIFQVLAVTSRSEVIALLGR